MRARIQDWAKRNPVGTAVILNVVAIATTLTFTVIALGPDSLLDEECTGTGRSGCVESHGAAAFWAIFSGAVAIWILWRTVKAAKTGRLKKPDRAEAPDDTSGDSASLDR